MKKLLGLVVLPVLAGCLSSTVPDVSRWPIEYVGATPAKTAPRYGVTRVSQISVRAPFNTEELAVLRADGTIAFDPYNGFAALPSLLMKGVLFDALNSSGAFEMVIGPSSVAHAPFSVELMVTRLALDCQTDGKRVAVARLAVRILEGQTVSAVIKGEGSADAADGNYGQAFSKAVSAALASALGRLK